MAAVKELIAEGHHKVRETPEKLKYDTTRIRWRGNWRGTGLWTGGKQASVHRLLSLMPAAQSPDSRIEVLIADEDCVDIRQLT